MNRESAEILSLTALAFIVADERTLKTLLTQTGLTAEEMRAAAGTRGFLAGVLEFLTRHEDVLIAFCESEGIEPTLPARAAHELSRESGEATE